MITSMTLDCPKRAVVINSFNSKLVCPIPSQRLTPLISYSENIQIKEESSCSQKKGRKRSLDHLSYEEKLQRKKLKNREAAQTSRDRKKARMDELERVVKFLEKNNKDLRSEVSSLKVEKEEMRKENERLKEELQQARCAKEDDRLKEESRCARCALESTPGSAVSTVYPLPQGRSSHLVHRIPLLAHLVFLSSISILFWITMRVIHLRLKNFYETSPSHRWLQRISNFPSMKWWGSHQHSWNPASLVYLLPITTT